MSLRNRSANPRPSDPIPPFGPNGQRNDCRSAHHPGAAGAHPANQPVGQGSPGVLPDIPQALLREFVELQPMHARYEAVRQRILALLGQGARAEPGALSVSVEIDMRSRLTACKLTALLGEERVRWMLAHVEKTPYRHLVINSTPPSASRAPSASGTGDGIPGTGES